MGSDDGRFQLVVVRRPDEYRTGDFTVELSGSIIMLSTLLSVFTYSAALFLLRYRGL